MTKFNYLVFLISFLVLFISCSKDINEDIASIETAELTKEETFFQSLEELNDPLLSDQLEKTSVHLENIISDQFNHLLIERDVADLFLDTDNILFERKSDGTISYSLFMAVPQESGNNDLNLNGYLTLDFNSDLNTNNRLQIGYQMEYALDFDEEGVIRKNGTSLLNSYYTPKPSNIPSKAPKRVICSYDWNGATPSAVASYCYSGGYGIAYGVPPPQWVIDLLNASEATHNTDDLYVLIRYWYDTSGTIYTIPFNQFYSSLKNEFITFYNTIDANGTMITPNYLNPEGNATETYHVHKQAFIDSFQRWLFTADDYYPNTYNYLVANSQVLNQVFNFFADYNLDSDADEGVYLSVPYGIYSSNPKVACISKMANHLNTSSGLALLQQLGSGTISYSQFENSLLAVCN